MTELERLLGLEHFEKLREAFGGTRLFVPQGIEPSKYRDQLEAKVGEGVVGLLIFHFPGDRVYIPTGRPRHRVDDKRVAELTRAGKSVEFIALALSCSDRAVYLARKRCRARGILPS